MAPPDPETLEAALESHGWLRRLARSLVRDEHRADDAVQETLVRAFERGPTDRASLRGWLAAVLRNHVRQERRGSARRGARERARHEHASASEAAPATDEVAARLELERRVLDAVRALEEPYRRVVVLRWFEGRSAREIARRDGVPLKTVRTRLDRALAKLRARLERDVDGGLSALVPLALAPALPWSDVPWSTSGTWGTIVGTKAKAGVVAGAVCVAAVGSIPLMRALAPADGAAAVQPADALAALAPAADVRERAADGGEAALAAQSAPTARERVGVGVPARSASPRASGAPPANEGTWLVTVVRARTGVPIESVGLRVQAPAAPGAPLDVAHELTNALGRADVDVPSGVALALTADHEGAQDPYDPTRRVQVELEPLEQGERRELVVRLPHGLDRAFFGRVVAADTDEPLEGARIAYGSGRESPDDVATTSAADGSFRIPYASWQPGALHVSLAGWATERIDVLRVNHDELEPHLVRMRATASLVVRVAWSRRAPADCELVVRGDAVGVRVAFDGLGVATVEDLPPGVALRAELWAADELAWREPEPLVLERGERRELAWDLDAGARVVGSLTDDAGRRVAGHAIWAVPADDRPGDRRLLADWEVREAATTTTTDESGAFELVRLPPGAYWIGPGAYAMNEEPPDDAVAPEAARIVVTEPPSDAIVDLVCARGLFVRGVVLGPGDRPLVYAAVRGQPEHGRGESRTTARSDGTFRLGPLAPGPYRLSAWGSGTFGMSGGFEARAGDEGVVLRLGVKHTVAGRVVGTDGAPCDAHVHLLFGGGGGSLGQGTSSRDMGAFLFTDLRPGTYSVQAETADGRVACVGGVTVPEGGHARDVELVLEPATRVRVVLSGERGGRVAIFARGIRVADATVAPGREALEYAPAGPLRVELYSGGETLAVRELVGAPGRVETLELELPPEER